MGEEPGALLPAPSIPERLDQEATTGLRGNVADISEVSSPSSWSDYSEDLQMGVEDGSTGRMVFDLSIAISKSICNYG
jgi:hypothetical protein